jgi:aldehyde dehydrogenase (NAD+)
MYRPRLSFSAPKIRLGFFAAALQKTVESFYGKTEEDREASPDLSANCGSSRLFPASENLVSDAVSKGARLEFGGRFDIEKRYAAPTLLTEVRPDMDIMAEEIFGPILPVLSYDSLGEVIAFIRARPKPLALYVLGRDKKSAERIIGSTTSGSAAVNDLLVQIENLDAPFGGVGMSGNGQLSRFLRFQNFLLMSAMSSTKGLSALSKNSILPTTLRHRNGSWEP